MDERNTLERRENRESEQSRARNAYLDMMQYMGFQKYTSREKAKAIWALRCEFRVSLLLEVSGLPRSTYYYYT